MSKGKKCKYYHDEMGCLQVTDFLISCKGYCKYCFFYKQKDNKKDNKKGKNKA